MAGAAHAGKGLLGPQCFARFLDSLPFRVFRIKGRVRFPEKTRFRNYVGGQAGWTDLGNAGDTELAFVAWDTDPGPLLERLESCRVRPPLP
ncbi:MAG: GTP-binding protein [Deltaproteobacteria bacterium]|nr:GTP-binding protein [Deltaproteobacteria bacterium]MBW1922909.1 GTP-binding protein [Deltaproteobacteria bacterium]MBW1949236.1 GTP-binding protein [Deltaproteobacteria bacterium]MBW2006887.1 GTP-binding protein [Deltaproteobacteria bacterium]MBW2101453.1 GTP-binding protein [Deltaproteobacteria bacterium]